MHAASRVRTGAPVGCRAGDDLELGEQLSDPKRELITQLASVLAVSEEFLRTGQNPNGAATDSDATKADDAEPFPSVIEKFRRKVALVTGMPPS